MTTTTQPHAEVTLAMANAAYDRVMDRVRDRHNPPAISMQRAESWEQAAAHVVMGLTEWEATVVFRYLLNQGTLAAPDAVLAETLAARLRVQIVFARQELWG